MTIDTELDQRLRRTFSAVAATVDTDPVPWAVQPQRRRRRWVIGAGIAVVAVPLAAAATIGFGPEHVDRIPPENPLLSGTLDGERYWVVDAFHTDTCDRPMDGVELLIQESNIVGQEWNTVGYQPSGDGRCGTLTLPDDPSSAYYLDGGSTIGDAMLWLGVVPEDIDEVRATADGDPVDVRLLPHEGAEYFVVEVPPGTVGFTVDFVAGGEVVAPPPDESREHVVP